MNIQKAISNLQSKLNVKIDEDTLRSFDHKYINENYKKLNETSIPYYRFPKSKDGVSIPRVIYNIFNIFRDKTSIKPNIIIPNNLNIYSTLL